MTPEQKEEIKKKYKNMDYFTMQHTVGLLLTALEETEQRHQKVIKRFTGQYEGLERDYLEAQQTIARQREALLATGLPEWAVDTLGEGTKES